MSKTVFQRIPKWQVVVFAVAALIGFTDAAFLTAEHVRGVVPPCSVVSGCEQVLTSPYAAIAGMPVSVLGMLFYGTILVLIIAFLDSYDRRVLHVACWLASAGFLATLYFVYVQAFIIHSFCQYCLLSALTSLILLLVGARIMSTD